MLLLGEVFGRVLWQTGHAGIKFTGAMLATVCAWIGLYVLARGLMRRWSR